MAWRRLAAAGRRTGLLAPSVVRAGGPVHRAMRNSPGRFADASELTRSLVSLLVAPRRLAPLRLDRRGGDALPLPRMLPAEFRGRRLQLAAKRPRHELRPIEARRGGNFRHRPRRIAQQLHSLIQSHAANFLGGRASQALAKPLFQRPAADGHFAEHVAHLNALMAAGLDEPDRRREQVVVDGYRVGRLARDYPATRQKRRLGRSRRGLT